MIKRLLKGKPKSPYQLCSVRSLPGHPQTPSLAVSPPLDHCAKFYFSAMISNIPSTYSSCLGFGKKDRHNASIHWSTNSPGVTKRRSLVTLSRARLCASSRREKSAAAQKQSPLWWRHTGGNWNMSDPMTFGKHALTLWLKLHARFSHLTEILPSGQRTGLYRRMHYQRESHYLAFTLWCEGRDTGMAYNGHCE